MPNDDMNFMLIPGELSAPSKRRGLEGYGDRQRASVEQAYGGSAPAPSSSTTAASGNSTKTTAQLNRETSTTTDNYAKAYREKQRAYEEGERRKQEVERAATDKALSERNAKMQEDATRAQARDLDTQLRYWRGQQGQNTHDSGTVNGQIAQLEQQLNAIDPKYWS